MASLHDDPFFWDVDRIVKELCTPQRSFPGHLASKLPDPERLAPKLREQGVDGESLLIYEDVTHQPIEYFLRNHLDLLAVPERLCLIRVIDYLKKNSRGYDDWKVEGFSRNAAMEVPTPASSHAAGEPDVCRPDGETGACHAVGQLDAEILRSASPQPASPRPCKKRRLAPRSLTTVTGDSAQTRMDAFRVEEVHAGGLDLSELSRMYDFEAENNSGNVEDFIGDGFGYLGRGTLIPAHITNSKFAEDAAKAFSHPRRAVFPLGRRLQINRAMIRQHLRGAARPENEDDDEEGSDDSGLPIFGESDGEDDLQTLREIEEEEREEAEARRREEEKLAKLKLLSHAEVEAVMQHAIEGFRALWVEDKKPKFDHKAWRLWNLARQLGSRLAQIDRAQKDCQHLQTRLASQKEAILDMEWTNAAEVEAQCKSFDLTVFTMAEKQWLLQLLQNPVQPARPETLRRPRTSAPKPAVTYESGDEILESESSDMDDFVVDDEAGGSTPEDVAAPDTEEAALVDEIMRDVVDRSAQEPADGEDATGPADQDHAMDVDNHDGYISPAEDEAAHGDDVSVPMSIDDDKDHSPGEETKPLDTESQNLVTPQLSRFSKDSVSPSDPTKRKLFATLYTTPGDKDIPLRSPATGTVSKPISLVDSLPTTPVPGSQDTPGSQAPLPELHELAAIAQRLPEWEKNKDPKRLVVGILWKWKPAQRGLLLQAVQKYEADVLWDEFIIKRTLHPKGEDVEREDIHQREAYGFLLNAGFLLTKLFYAYVKCRSSQALEHDMEGFTGNIKKQIKRRHEKLGEFLTFVKSIMPHFPDPVVESGVTLELPPADDESSGLDQCDDAFGSDHEDVAASSQKKTRYRPRNLESVRRQHSGANQAKEFEKRRLLLQQKLSRDAVPDDQARLIINVSKASEAAGYVYVPDDIAIRIKDYQIRGVQFMWNLVVASNDGEGCLLAHTMGLGKTMQVITLLVAIATASKSRDPSVRSQVPKELRESKTLVLCPAGLVQNWIDELLTWAPKGALGELKMINADMKPVERSDTAQTWAANGGVLVIGYTLMRSLAADEELQKLFLESPNLVVADEAHHFKNPKSKISLLVSQFRTKSRIAMTGSPLSNEPHDYYSMINWISPRFLGDETEFSRLYANPIKEGFYRDSTTAQKRKALTHLKSLTRLLEPKANRMDHSALAGQLTNKREFLIEVPLTKVQDTAYRVFVQEIFNDVEMTKSQAQIWAFCSNLSTLLAHPYIFRKVLLDKRTSTSKEGSETAEDAADTATLSVDMVNKLLAVLPEQGLDDNKLSNKVRLLLHILDESKKVGDKVLVFSQSLRTLNYLTNIMKRQRRVFYRLDGKTSVSSRQTTINEFNVNDQAEVYLISTKAGGVGLNMYGANRVVIFDFKFVPTDEQQAIGRAYRIGQTKPVFVYWLICAGTFESVIQNKSVFKKQLASRVVDKKNPVAWAKRAGDYFQMPVEPPQEELSTKCGQDTILDTMLKNKDFAGLIRSVQSTDTFEQEENADLTAEEEREADIILQRSRAGGGFANLASTSQNHKVHADQSSGVQQMPPMSSSRFPAPSLRTREPFSSLPPSRPKALGDELGPFDLRPRPGAGLQGGGHLGVDGRPHHGALSRAPHLPNSEDLFGPTGSYPSPPPANQALPPSPSPAVTANSNPNPNPATPRQQADPPPSPAVVVNPATPSRQQPDPDRKRDVNQSMVKVRTDLEKIFNTYVADLKREKMPWVHDAKAAANIIHEVVDIRGESGVARLDFLSKMKAVLSSHPDFAKAILLGKVTADYLAGMTYPDLMQCAASQGEVEHGQPADSQAANSFAGRHSKVKKSLSVHGKGDVTGMQKALVRRSVGNPAGKEAGSVETKVAKGSRTPQPRRKTWTASEAAKTPATDPAAKATRQPPGGPGDSSEQPYVID